MGKKIIILYYSKEGNTKILAKRIFYIFNEFDPKDIKIEMMDANEIDYSLLKSADALIIGSPDYFSYPAGKIKTFFDELYDSRDDLKGRPAFCFISHGGKGKALKYLEDLATSIKLKLVGAGISVKNDDISLKIESQIKKNLQEMFKLLK